MLSSKDAKKPWVKNVTVHERTKCVILHYQCSRDQVISSIRAFTWREAERVVVLPIHSSRELNREFEEKLTTKIIIKVCSMIFMPKPIHIARILWHALRFFRKGICCLLKRRMKVDLLDAFSIGISVFRKDFKTAGTVMFLFELGELLEEWTRRNLWKILLVVCANGRFFCALKFSMPLAGTFRNERGWK